MGDHHFFHAGIYCENYYRQKTLFLHFQFLWYGRFIIHDPALSFISLSGKQFSFFDTCGAAFKGFPNIKNQEICRGSYQIAKSTDKQQNKNIRFIFGVLIISVIAGALMYIIEGPEHGFTSIPLSVYWCIVTLTTVGFGDIAPATPLGQLLATVIMIMGYGIIAVPTGIVTAEYSKSIDKLDVLGKDYV